MQREVLNDPNVSDREALYVPGVQRHAVERLIVVALSIISITLEYPRVFVSPLAWAVLH